MSLFKILRPRWNNPDSVVRQNAVSKMAKLKDADSNRKYRRVTLMYK